MTLTRSRRAMAGSRLNKHHPVARQTRWSDAAAARALPTHVLVRGWGGVPGDCGVECSCGVGFDGFETIGQAETLRRDHAEHPRRPHHTTRAVSITACFGGRVPDRDSAKAEAARRAGDRGRSAATMTVLARRAAYLVPGGHFEHGPLAGRSRRVLTPRQLRRIAHKARRCGEWVA